MLNIDFLKNSGNFKKISLRKGDILFDEGDIDNNLYFIEKGKISIEKYTSIDRKNTKVLAVLGKLDFFGEGSLSNAKAKEVRILAKTDIELLFIDTIIGVEKLIKNYPSEGLSLLKHLIDITNIRLLKSNAIVTATYEINRQIISLSNITIKSIFEIINSIQSVVICDYILYLEKKDTIIDRTIILKYNTSKGMKLLDNLIELKEDNLVIEDLVDYKSNYNYIQNLSVGDRNLGYLIFCNNEKEFTHDNKKIILSITPSLAGVIRQKEIITENNNKEFISNI